MKRNLIREVPHLRLDLQKHRPHLTLLRTKNGGTSKKEILSITRSFFEGPSGRPFKIAGLDLIESRLSKKGLRHSVLQHYPVETKNSKKARDTGRAD